MVRQEMTRLDTAAHASGRTVRRVGRQVATFDSANHARRAVPLTAQKQRIMDLQLLGGYADEVGSLTPSTIGGAYGELLRACGCAAPAGRPATGTMPRPPTSASMPSWPACAPDLPARDELRIRAWQAEFTALRASRTAKDLKAATKRR